MTFFRWALAVLALLAAIVAGYALFIDNSQTKLPLLVSSLAVFAIAVGLLGFALAGSAIRYGEAERAGRALGTAFIAGLLVMIAAGSLGMAIVLGILAGGL